MGLPPPPPPVPPTDTVTFDVGTDYAACWQPVPFHVGTDYAMWARITVNSIFLPTSQRNRCPHQSVFGAHIHWNQLPTWTGIRTLPTTPGTVAKSWLSFPSKVSRIYTTAFAFISRLYWSCFVFEEID